jgi:hypothetical protein
MNSLSHQGRSNPVRRSTVIPAGALLLPESQGSWRAAVKNITRLILSGELPAEELLDGASISNKDGRIALQESAAREYGFGGRQGMEWAINQMDAFAKLQGLPSFETLRFTRLYIDCLRSNPVWIDQPLPNRAEPRIRVLHATPRIDEDI